MLEVSVINNYIRLSFTSMKQAVIGTEVAKLLLSPYLITECMLVKEEAKKKELADLEVAHKSKLEELEAVKVLVG